jgi:putative ABC transport system permease protein
MKASDLGELALRNLREALLRNSLTTLGVAVGVASLVAMLSLGVGLQQFTNQRLASSGLFNAIFVAPRTNMDLFRNDTAAPIAHPPALDEAARLRMEHLPSVVAVYPQIRFVTELRFDKIPYTTVVAGLPQADRGDGAFDGMQGRFFSSSTADEAILDLRFAHQLSKNPASLIGQDLVLRYAARESLSAQTAATDSGSSSGASSASSASGAGAISGFSVVPRQKKLKIVGIIQREPEAGFGGFRRTFVYIPLDVAQSLQATQISDLRDVLQAPGAGPGGRRYASLTVRVKSSANVVAVENTIKKMGFHTFSLFDASRNLRLLFALLDLLLGIFGSLALAVATLGIVNTLVMAILERRREIGVLKALGAADADVKQLFFAEAGVMGVFGGIFGVGLGWFIGRLLTWGTNFYLHRQSLPSVDVSAVPWWLALGAIAFAVGVSLAAGIYPAARAAKLNPVEALRYE